MTSNGTSQQTKPDPCSFVIFGVTGDLAHRLVLPALYNLAESKLLPEKFLFGTDYPFLKPDKWLAAFNELGLDDDVKMQILRDNAVRLFRLD